ncbi:hypothetical protein NUU61_008853 [Penicillium alfredii]|uniref:Uncharacterized protein n=1 Tax=Penicillium alfredii TaxID=1506179 RepID=A0A9W9EM67_9EURO|nr:uncharacterized protein NUU61_008853 [Penicillium alfredii]KAJ5084274.1 hypothetical protein NUU61_008853 [Penicillium alfredii]
MSSYDQSSDAGRRDFPSDRRETNEKDFEGIKTTRTSSQAEDEMKGFFNKDAIDGFVQRSLTA